VTKRRSSVANYLCYVYSHVKINHTRCRSVVGHRDPTVSSVEGKPIQLVDEVGRPHQFHEFSQILSFFLSFFLSFSLLSPSYADAYYSETRRDFTFILIFFYVTLTQKAFQIRRIGSVGPSLDYCNAMHSKSYFCAQFRNIYSNRNKTWWARSRYRVGQKKHPRG
jgi:hypothetical protein